VTKSLAEMTAEVEAWCVRKGWRPSANTFGDNMALLHSEISEAVEAYRDNATGPFWLDADGRVRQGLAPEGTKPEGVPSELADVLIRLLDDCAAYGIDLEAEYERKMAYNERRPWRHGGRAL
jgi:NTP pyrophosphatase (non-canonical NTP hydrolase)